jgi:rare lipoprotein A (peptidoglycan hydrolase)
MTIQTPDPGARSAGTLDERSILVEPPLRTEPSRVPPRAAQPKPSPGAVAKDMWRTDRDISWYGPGFYGHHTACGQTLTRSLVGVAHRTLPCGTKILFHNPSTGATILVPVVDRGPYVAGRTWDLTAGACLRLGHCYTGPIKWKYATGG